MYGRICVNEPGDLKNISCFNYKIYVFKDEKI